MNEEGRVFHVSSFTPYFLFVPDIDGVSLPVHRAGGVFQGADEPGPRHGICCRCHPNLAWVSQKRQGCVVKLQSYLFRGRGSWVWQAISAASGETILGLRESLTWATACLTGVDSSVAVSSGGELFLRFISLTSLEHQVSGLPAHSAEVQRIRLLPPSPLNCRKS